MEDESMASKTDLAKNLEAEVVLKTLKACGLTDKESYSDEEAQRFAKARQWIDQGRTYEDIPALLKQPDKDKVATKATPPKSDAKPHLSKEKSTESVSVDGTVTDKSLEVRDTAISHLSQVVDEQMAVLATQDAPGMRERMKDAYMQNLAQAMQNLPPLAQADFIDVKALKQNLLERQQQRKLALEGQAARQLPAAQQ
jgi:DNA-binding transcriptional MerR regulator